MGGGSVSIFGSPAVLITYQDQKLCVPPFQVVCPFGSLYFLMYTKSLIGVKRLRHSLLKCNCAQFLLLLLNHWLMMRCTYPLSLSVNMIYNYDINNKL